MLSRLTDRVWQCRLSAQQMDKVELHHHKALLLQQAQLPGVLHLWVLRGQLQHGLRADTAQVGSAEHQALTYQAGGYPALKQGIHACQAGALAAHHIKSVSGSVLGKFILHGIHSSHNA